MPALDSPSPGCPVRKHGEDQPPPKATARQGWRQATAAYPAERRSSAVALAAEDGKPGVPAP